MDFEDWSPLIIEDPGVLIKYHQLKLAAEYDNDCEFLLYLLNLLESQHSCGNRVKEELLEDKQAMAAGSSDPYLPLECIMENEVEETGSESEYEESRPTQKNIQRNSRRLLDTSYASNQPNQQDFVENQMFTCYICICVELESATALIEHFQEQHPNDKPFKCVCCNACFFDLTDLTHHANNLSHEWLYVCEWEDCKKKLIRRAHFDNHMRKIHGTGKSYPCDLCDKKYFIRSSLTSHKINVHDHRAPNQNDKEFECNQCDNTYSMKRALLAHKRAAHPRTMAKSPPIRSFSCYNCPGFEFGSEKKLKDHFKRLHVDEKPFQCVSCKECFSEHTELRRHANKLKHEGIYRCEECNKTYYRRSYINDHNLRWHSDGKSFPCDQCDKKYSTRSALYNHKNSSHDNVDKYKCEQCGKNCFNGTFFREHKEMHEGIRRICPVCGKQFDTQFRLNCHVKYTHSDVPRTHSCEVCGNKYKTAGELKSHQRVHDKNRTRDFGCDRCEKTFMSKTHFKLHMKWHNDIRDYVCEVCSKTFLTSATLKEHIRTHTGERPYKCTMCTSDFKHSGALYTHVKLKHKGFKISLRGANKKSDNN